jgi:hypothetical protein
MGGGVGTYVLDSGAHREPRINDEVTEMNKLLATVALIGLMASTSQAAWAASHHAKAKLAHSVTTTQRVRNAQDYYVAPADGWTSGAFQYDEALSPPAGH